MLKPYDFTAYRQSRSLRAAAGSKLQESVPLQCVLFYVVFSLIITLESMPPAFFYVPELLVQASKDNLDLYDSKAIMDFAMNFKMSTKSMLTTLYATGFGTMLAIIYCTDVEQRPPRSMGFTKRKMLRDSLLGAVFGIALLGGAVLFCWATGAVSYAGTAYSGKVGLLCLLLLGWLIQGMSEEVIFRGYFCNSLARKCSPHLAALLSAIAFALAHLFNPGKTLLSMPNLILFGLFAAYFMFRFDSIWGISLIHAFWNFSQGNLFGISVSGMQSDVSVLRFTANDGATLIHGGQFGLEGGLGVTIVLVIGLLLLWFVPERGEKTTS